MRKRHLKDNKSAQSVRPSKVPLLKDNLFDLKNTFTFLIYIAVMQLIWITQNLVVISVKRLIACYFRPRQALFI